MPQSVGALGVLGAFLDPRWGLFGLLTSSSLRSRRRPPNLTLQRTRPAASGSHKCTAFPRLACPLSLVVRLHHYGGLCDDFSVPADAGPNPNVASTHGMTTPPAGFEASGIDGRTFRITDEGEGEPVLLVHGGSSGPADWDRVASHLAKCHRVLRYTRFTYRSDPPPAGTEAMAGEVHDVLAITDIVGTPVVAIGHSSGAIVVLESVLADLKRFAGMVLYEPPVAVTEPLGGEALRRARRAVEDGDTDGAVWIFFREIAEVPGFLVGALKLVKPIWRRLRMYAPAQMADTEAIESLGVGVERYKDLRVPALLLGGVS